jgi:hypothetical protein
LSDPLTYCETLPALKSEANGREAARLGATGEDTLVAHAAFQALEHRYYCDETCGRGRKKEDRLWRPLNARFAHGSPLRGQAALSAADAPWNLDL